ncbi:outer membrane lipoprotein-sorting protein [Candidatus Uabimicrobium sp. HlEnr_7]|uniref:outer membrane lipoprotein-sorting protein n=1 Tax=Candidatus Uabimicrobium helgolandensis TaxID=3095367 RepID=UPI00355673C0
MKKKDEKRQTLRISQNDLRKNQPSSGIDLVFEHVMEEDFPKYRMQNGKTIREDGTEVPPEEIIEEYSKLKTEVRRLDQLTRTMYQTQQHNVTMVRLEKQQSNRRRWFSFLVFAIVMISTVLVILIIKGLKEKDILREVATREKEKQLIEQQLREQQKQSKEKLELLEDKYTLEKELLTTKLEKSKQLELNKLRKTVKKSQLSEPLSMMEKKLEKKYQTLYNNMQKKLNRRLIKEQNTQQKKLESMEKAIQVKNSQQSQRLNQEKELLRRELEKEKSALRQQLEKTKQELSQLKSQGRVSPSFTKITTTDKSPQELKERQVVRISAQSVVDKDILKKVSYKTKTTQVNIVFTSKNQKVEATLYSKNEPGKRKELLKVTQPSLLRGNANLFVETEQGNRYWKYETREQKFSRAQAASKLFASEFSYQDWFEEDLEDYEYKYITTRSFMERSCYVIQAKLKKTSQQIYTKKYYWIDVSNSVALQIKYFTAKSLQKIYFVESVAQVGNVWKPKSAFIIDVPTRKRTKVAFSNWKVNIPISDSTFSPQSLYKN